MLKLGFASAGRPGASSYLCISVALFLIFLLSCIHSMDKAKDPPHKAAESRTEVEIKQSWNGDYPVDQLAALPEKADQKGTGYIGDPQTFSAVWSVFKPGGPVPDIDFTENLVIFVHNIRYYNRISIGKIVLKKGVIEVLAMETMSARPIEDVVAMSMAAISHEGVTGIQSREGVIDVGGVR